MQPSEIYQLQESADAAERFAVDVAERVYWAADPRDRDKDFSQHPDVVAARAEADRLREARRAAQAQVGGIVFRVAVDNLPELRKRLEKLNRKAAKLDTGHITLTETDETVVLNYNPEYGKYAGTRSFDFEHRYCVLAGETPRVEGFEFIATIQHTEQGNLVRRVPAIRAITRIFNDGTMTEEQMVAKLESIDLTGYYHADPTCDHCGTNRRRNNTYVVYEVATGEVKRVGHTCLRDFMGNNNPERVAAILEEVREFCGDLNRGGGERIRPQTEDFLVHAATMIRVDCGYQRGGETGRNAYSNWASMLFESRDRDRQPLWVTPEDTDRDLARAALKWAREDWNESSDYCHSVKVALANEMLPDGAQGIAASVFVAYERYLGRKLAVEAEAAKSPSEWVGQIGERREFTLTLESIRWIESRYSYDGTKPMFKFVDADGNRFVWFASNMPRTTLQREGVYRVKGTVKKHSEFKDVKETTLTRVAVEEVVFDPETEVEQPA